MTYSVYAAEFDAYLNLSLPDLGRPDLPGLWEILRADDRPALERGIICPECLESRPNCPEVLVLVEMPDGRRFARHYNTSIADHDATNESDEHKAYKERIAKAAELGGHAVEVEDRAEDGRRRTDVLVKGDDVAIGWEVQLTYASLDSVRRRSQIARDGGITPSWMVVNDTREFINRVPWTRTNDLSWKYINEGQRLPIRGGVRILKFYTCDWGTSTDCPAGKNRCGNRHAKWDSIADTYEWFQLDDLVRATAAGEYVPIIVKEQARINRFWVLATERDRWLDAGGVLLDEDDPRARRVGKKQLELDPQPFDPTCRYGIDTGFRSPPAPIRDDPAAIVTAVTLKGPGCRALAGNGDKHTRCEKPARLYLGGYRCEEHKP